MTAEATPIERTAAMPKPGVIPAFDAGWEAHAAGLGRDTVRALAADPEWALLGWDCRYLRAAPSLGISHEEATARIHRVRYPQP